MNFDAYLVDWAAVTALWEAEHDVRAVVAALVGDADGQQISWCFDHAHWIDDGKAIVSALDVLENIGELSPRALLDDLHAFVDPLWGFSEPIQELASESDTEALLALTISPATVVRRFPQRLIARDKAALAQAIDLAPIDREWFIGSGAAFNLYLDAWIAIFSAARERGLGIVVTSL